MPEGVGYGPQSTASTGLTLSYVGKHAYAHSGAFAASTTAKTVLNFDTGSTYLVGKFTLNACLQYETTDIDPTYMRIQFNGEQVSVAAVAEPGADSPSFTEQKMLIPPYTSVIVECWASGNDANDLGNARFIGKVYGKID